MQLPETHMKPVVLDKCISFQFNHWSLCDWEKSFLAYEHEDTARTPNIHILLKGCTDQNRTQIQAVEGLFSVTLCDVDQTELDLHLQVNWYNRNRSSQWSSWRQVPDVHTIQTTKWFYFTVGQYPETTVTNTEMVCSSLQHRKLVQTLQDPIRSSKMVLSNTSFMPEYLDITEQKVLISPVAVHAWLDLTLFYLLVTVKWWVGRNVNICSKIMSFYACIPSGKTNMYVFRPFIYETIYIHQGWLTFYFRESFRMEKLLYPLHIHRSKQITPKQDLHARQSLKFQKVIL